MDKLTDILASRFKNALVWNFLLVWIFLHWPFFVTLFWGDTDTAVRISELQSYLSGKSFEELWGKPLLSAVALILFAPLIRVITQFVSGWFEDFSERAFEAGKNSRIFKEKVYLKWAPDEHLEAKELLKKNYNVLGANDAFQLAEAILKNENMQREFPARDLKALLKPIHNVIRTKGEAENLKQ